MIRKSAPNPNSPSTRRKIDQLYTCVRYCEDEFRCRRTMQLEFFGETFHRKVCGKTCDNCRSGREPDHRDMTDAAKSLLELFDEIAQQRGGRGTTLTQLSELFRGSKSQAATKNLKVNRLKNYGKGSKYKKPDIDRITHAMIFERLLEETSVVMPGGFSVDYVAHGENAPAVLYSGRRFKVEFPKAGSSRTSAAPSTTKKKETKAAKKTTSSTTKKTASTKKTPATKRTKTAISAKSRKAALTAIENYENGLQFSDGDDGNDSDGSVSAASWDAQTTSSRRTTKSDTPAHRLPARDASSLAKKIKELTVLWANEEMLVGNQVFCKWFWVAGW